MKDPYEQSNGTLKNKLGISDYTRLREAEKDISYVKIINADIVYKGKIDVDFIKSIHKHIFEDIYDWAGEYRTVPIFKREMIIPGVSLDYAPPKEIDTQLEKHMEEMNSQNWDTKDVDKLVKQFAGSLAKIWRVHPFRDGNTRTTLTFANIFAKEHGFDLDMSVLLDDLGRQVNKYTGEVRKWSIRDKFVLASLDKRDYPEPQALEQILKKAIISGGKIKVDKNDQVLER